MRMAKLVATYLLLICFFNSLCQKYNFVNWTVEDGLIQSQAYTICQDRNRQLWIGTEGGVSRFDGKKFTGYTVQDGLVSNHINTMFCDKDGNLWIGTNHGISVFDGKKFSSIKTMDSRTNNVSDIVQTEAGDVFTVDNLRLFRIRDFKSQKLIVSGDSSEQITSLSRPIKGEFIVSIYEKGLFAYANGKSEKLNGEDGAWQKLIVRNIFVTTAHDTLICTNRGLFRFRNRVLIDFETSTGYLKDPSISCVAEDSQHNLWLGSDNGCYKVEGNRVLRFDEKSGFTDNAVNQIYRDVENNLWFATNADGIYKFRENTFTYYDKSSGLANTIIMGITQARDKTIYTAGYGGGLYQINSRGDVEEVVFHGKTILSDSKINCLYADDENNIWIGTVNRGTYSYNEKSGLKKLEAKNHLDITLRDATAFLKDLRGNLFIGTNQGLYIKDKDGTISRIKLVSNLIRTLKQFDRDHVIVGTSKGVFLLDQNYTAQPFHEKVFGDASVLCLSKNGVNIWIGTTDKGVLNWNSRTGKTITYTTNDGLPSNFIYSIDVSDKNKAWIGTGFGISNLQLGDDGKVLAVKNYGRSDGLLGMECNHNCLLKAADSSLWFGTTKGLFHFNPATNITEKNQPFVLLRSVKLFSSLITDSSRFKSPGTWFNLPQGLVLGSKQNHLTFELGSIYFTNPDDVLFKYKLEGIDKGYTTTNNPYIIYPALPPGKYTLKVTGLTKGGAVSVNELSYSFEIEKAFYQTRFFQLLVILLLLGTGALLAYIFTRGKQRRKQKAKELLEKIREEEFMKLRQRTAEDFHDEMGNSLTRISVLTDILKSKINGKEQEVTSLVSQIKENTTALYNGSKDIIWSLNSQNDGLFEITEHIKDIGNELFQETAVDFKYRHNISPGHPLKLKLDYSRNLTMIFKEAYSNILKHSRASAVTITIHLDNQHRLDISIRDNGRGFNPETAQKGNGLKNMRNRVSRMNGTMTTSSRENNGTETHILLNNIFS